MKKIRKFFILLKIILIIFLIYIYGANGKTLYLSEVYQSLGEVLGGFRSVLILYLTLAIFSDFISDSNKRIVFLIRLNFFFVFYICISNLQLLFYILDLDKEGLDKKIFIYLYIDRNLGMLITMFLYKFYFLVSVNFNIVVTGTVLFFSSFILFGKIIGNTVRKILKYFSKESHEKRKKIRTLIKEKKIIKKQIVEKERQEKIEIEKQLIIEKTMKKQRQEKISELKNKIEKNKKISIEKQLNISGVEIIESKIEKTNKTNKDNKIEIKENVTEGQLHFEFKKEEV